MVAAERYRFAAKRDAVMSRRQARREISGGTVVALVYIGMIVLIILVAIIGGGSGSGGSGSAANKCSVVYCEIDILISDMNSVT